MGYQVYEDPDHPSRWAGYGVPAECDWGDCHAQIDRGLGYKCEDHGGYALMLDGQEIGYDRIEDEPTAVEEWAPEEGCGLFFCETHRFRTPEHGPVQPKPDSLEWEAHLLSDASWAPWREEHPDLGDAMRARALQAAEASR